MAHDLAASVRARLLNIARAEQTDFNSVLVAFLKKNALPAVPLTSASTPPEPIQQKYGSQIEPYWLECGS